MASNQPADQLDLSGIRALAGYHREALVAIPIAVVVLLAYDEPRTIQILYGVTTLIVLWMFRRPLSDYLHTSRVRRQWEHAVIHAGAADPPPNRSRKAHRASGPKARKVRRTPIGDLLLVEVGRGRGTVESLTQHRHQLAADLDASGARVREVRVAPTDRASRAEVLIVRRDPFKDAAPPAWPNEHADQLSMWDPIPLGVDENGQTVHVTLVEKNLLLGGEPGAGKSATLSLICATAALDPQCRLYLLDGKRVELAAWEPSAEGLVGPNIEEANVLLQHLRNVMEHRYQELLAGGLRKVQDGWTLHVLVCDELALYLQDPDTKKAALFTELLRDLIARGRAAGIIVVAATQKPSVDVVPSKVRDLMALRMALRCTTSQASDTILGQGWASDGADASSVPIAQRGVGWLLAEGERPVKLKMFYLTDTSIGVVAGRAAGNRVDGELAGLLAAHGGQPDGPVVGGDLPPMGVDTPSKAPMGTAQPGVGAGPGEASRSPGPCSGPDRAEVIRRLRLGESQQSIERATGVSRRTVGRIKRQLDTDGT